ncbi:AAA family ATPase [Candidatus Woesearchaeota archaeon]|nr:AAA family ATPase [Candidatus Woesearchaeota archaeon]
MEWYEELYFDENPFDTNPKRFADKLVGLHDVLDELFYRVSAGSIVFIEGKDGFGKSSLLWNIIKKYKGKGKIIYVDCSAISYDLNIEKLLINSQGLGGRLLRKMPQGMILLLDNVNELSKTNTERVKFFFDQGYLRSVIMTGEALGKLKLSPSLVERIGKRIIKLKELDQHQAVALVRHRIEDSEMIDDELIQEVFKRSDKNPRKLLENLEKLFMHAVERNEEKLTKEHLKITGG